LKYFWGSFVCANFGENRSRNVTVTVGTDTLTDANWFYNRNVDHCNSQTISVHPSVCLSHSGVLYDCAVFSIR